MHLKLLLASGLALTAGLAGGAYATMMSAPPVPSHSAYRTIADPETMTVSAESGAYLQDHPAVDGKILKRLHPGATVTVIEKVESGTWAHVKVGDQEGYIDIRLLK
jgi:uncharacterized protein YgiM (DUF1202 family)